MALAVDACKKGILGFPSIINDRIAWFVALNEIQLINNHTVLEPFFNNVEIMRIISNLHLSQIPSELFPRSWNLDFVRDYNNFCQLLDNCQPPKGEVICQKCRHHMYWDEIDKSDGFICQKCNYCTGYLKMYRDVVYDYYQ